MRREDEARYFRRLLVDNWEPVEGLTPENGLKVHTGEPDTISDDPQITIDTPMEEVEAPSGYFAFQGDGSGFWRRPDGSVDIRCVAGKAEDVDSHPRWFARQLAGEVQRILEVNWSGVPDENTGEVVYRQLSPGAYTGPMTGDEITDRWYAVQEARYTYATNR